MTYLKKAFAVSIFISLSHAAYSSDSVLEGREEILVNSGKKKSSKRKLFSKLEREKENNSPLFPVLKEVPTNQIQCGKRKSIPVEEFGDPAFRPKGKRKKDNQASLVTLTSSCQNSPPTKFVNTEFLQQFSGHPTLSFIEGVNIPQQIERDKQQDGVYELPKPFLFEKKSLQSRVPQFDEFISYESVLEKIKYLLEEGTNGHTVLVLDCHGTLLNIKDKYTEFPKSLDGAKEFLENLTALKKDYPNFYFLASSAYADQKNVLETLKKEGLSTFFDIPNEFEIETIDESGLTYKKCGLFCSVGVKCLLRQTNDRYPYKAFAPRKVFPNIDFETFILLDDQAKVHREFQEICDGKVIKARVLKKSEEEIGASEQIEITPSFPGLRVHHNILFSHPSLNDDDLFSSEVLM